MAHLGSLHSPGGLAQQPEPEVIMLKKKHNIGYALQSRDHTQNTQSNVDIEQLKAQLERSKAQAGSIAHESRNTFQVCLGNVETIQILLQDFDDMLSGIKNSIQRGLQMNTLTLDAILNKPLDLKTFTELSIQYCIDQTLQAYPLEVDEREMIHVDKSNDFTFKGLEAPMVHILVNLIKNALEALAGQKNGLIEIKVVTNKGTLNQLHISDNGPGIPADKQEAIFEPFVTHGKQNGTGLGLSFCKRVMESFNGNIIAESTEQHTRLILKFSSLK